MRKYLFPGFSISDCHGKRGLDVNFFFSLSPTNCSKVCKISNLNLLEHCPDTSSAVCQFQAASRKKGASCKKSFDDTSSPVSQFQAASRKKGASYRKNILCNISYITAQNFMKFRISIIIQKYHKPHTLCIYSNYAILSQGKRGLKGGLVGLVSSTCL